ncbi:RNAse P rpr2/Rpp21/SNM1 subunit domain-containing protein [Hirsutella rhossiliensis]
MASSQLTASLDFLTDAAHLLRGAAPETSAHLMRHRADLLSHANVPQHELQRQHVCSACGHIMIHGQAPEQAVRRRKGPRLPAAEATTAVTKNTDASKKTANASSKQRAKNRRAGLQALLSQQQQQQQQSSASSLTLADFRGK